MTDKDTTTDNDTEQPTRDELETRVEQLEQTVQQMLPSRRDALKLGGTALAAGALGSAATGSASAGTSSVGTIGSASNPLDAELEDINPGSVRAVEFNNNEITGVSSLSTNNLGNAGSPISLDDPVIASEGVSKFDVYSLQIAGGGKTALNPNADVFRGFVRISASTDDVFASLAVDGQDNSVTIQNQIGSNVTTTEGGSGSLNVYWDSTNERFEAENNEGNIRDYICDVLYR